MRVRKGVEIGESRVKEIFQRKSVLVESGGREGGKGIASQELGSDSFE